VVACFGVVLAGCQMTPAATSSSIGVAPPPQGTILALAAVQPTAAPTSQPTIVPTAASTATPLAPTPTPVAATVTPAAATATLAVSTATPAAPTATPDATEVAQLGFCDRAAPPAHLPLPLTAPFIRIPPPEVATQPTPATTGPQKKQGGDPPPHVTAPQVAVLDEGSGNLLFAQDAFSRRAPASITKIATTIVALERGPDIKTVYTTTVSAAALVNCDGSSVMGLEPDDHVKLETLLYGMMLPSGNDAAEQVAVSLAGSRERYVSWMNEKVAALHLRDTHFVTPSGMDSDEHYSSAYDMALLARYAMQNPAFRTLAATPFFVGDEYYMHNLNPLLSSYPGADGVKIGYTEIAGRTIVASATRDGHRVYVSLMGSRNLAGDCIALFDWVWKSFSW